MACNGEQVTEKRWWVGVLGGWGYEVMRLGTLWHLSVNDYNLHHAKGK